MILFLRCASYVAFTSNAGPQPARDCVLQLAAWLRVARRFTSYVALQSHGAVCDGLRCVVRVTLHYNHMVRFATGCVAFYEFRCVALVCYVVCGVAS